MINITTALFSLAIFTTILVLLIIKKHLDIISLPSLIGLTFIYLFLISPYILIQEKEIFRFVSEQQVAWGIWVPLFVLIAVHAGWKVALQNPVQITKRNSDTTEFNFDKFYKAGFIITLLGIVCWGYFLATCGGVRGFYSSVHGLAASSYWSQTSAYISGGILYIFPGLSILIIACTKAKMNIRRKLIPITILLLLLTHGFCTGGRGHLFRAISSAGVALALSTRRRPNPSAALAFGNILGLGLIMLGTAREYTPLGQWNKLKEVSISDTLQDTTTATSSGDEFICHAGTLATVDKTRKLGYGHQFLYYNFIQPIPRQLWPSKPYSWHYAGNTIARSDYVQALGWSLAYGSASGGIAVLYKEWGIFSVVAWWIIGYSFGRAYVRAIHPLASPWTLLVYSNLMAGSLQLIAQGFLTFWSTFLLQTGLSFVVISIVFQQRPKTFLRPTQSRP